MKQLLVILFLIVNNLYSQSIQLQPAFPNLTFKEPTVMISNGNKLYVAQKSGKILMLPSNSHTLTTNDVKIFLNLESKVSSNPVTGLLGLEFHPNHSTNRYIYVDYTIDSAIGTTGSPYWVCVSRFTVSSTNPDSVLLNSEKRLLKWNAGAHFGGTLEFGSDGFLYITTGDGALTMDSAQSKTSLLGKMLRIDVDNGNPYSIPSTNPYVNNNTGWKKEIYALGFRNPFKFSFDTVTNKLWLADVGDDRWEEINHVVNGGNYGWNNQEGTDCYPANQPCDTTGYNFILPFYQYYHTIVIGQFAYSITGGYVYHGTLNPKLLNKYIYGDFAKGYIWSIDQNAQNNNLLIDTNFQITSFGVDNQNELYVCRFQFNTYTQIYRVRQVSPDVNNDGVIDNLDVLIVYNALPQFITGTNNLDVNLDYVVDLTDLLIVFNSQNGF